MFKRIAPGILLGMWALVFSCAGAGAEAPLPIRFDQTPGRVAVVVQDQTVVTYRHDDPQTPRPYFTGLHTLDGIPVTRNHPPRAGDRDDHPLMHPGLWLAFGDLGGADSWRLKTKVQSESVVVDASSTSFTVRNRYEAAEGDTPVCHEVCRYVFEVRPAGLLIHWDSTFTTNRPETTFGDQEEMGLGVRLATPLAVTSELGGRILDADGRRNEKGLWGNTADWCDYSGPAQDRWVGLSIFTLPTASAKSWWHVRDYGVMVANSFGPRAGRPPRLMLKKGDALRLRYGVLVHSSKTEADLDLTAEYRHFTTSAAPETPAPR